MMNPMYGGYEKCIGERKEAIEQLFVAVCDEADISQLTERQLQIHF